MRKGDPAEILDRLLVSALIEVRSCERFAMLAAASGDAELAGFYEALFASEFGHYRVFLELARKMMAAPVGGSAMAAVAGVGGGDIRRGRSPVHESTQADPLRLHAFRWTICYTHPALGV